ncbi:Uncharacterised protein [Serratia quinivorans]|uniref:hypothetical protein n=1 Tax=Serratia quinivorans TaxID=137545 RepID=UPI00217C7AF8|nr:hypothetical protein [Serratia quinivorans]CAI1723049.1 Uncharacterised protein [Serratia quinivorans]
MSNNQSVEIAVWEDEDCTRQLVEFDLPDDICQNIDKFISEVNHFLVEKNYIEDVDSDPLTNLEYSQISGITSSKEINCDRKALDPHTKVLSLVVSRPKKMGISTRHKNITN